MAISIQCPHCEKRFHVRDDFAGRKGRCPQCGGVVQAPAASEAARKPPLVRQAPPVAEVSPAAIAKPAAVSASAVEPVAPAAVPTAGFAVDTGEESSVAARATGARRGGGSRKKPLWPILLVASALPVIAILVLVLIAVNREGGDQTELGEDAVAEADATSGDPANGSAADGAGAATPMTVADTDFAAPIKAEGIEQITEAMVKIITPLRNGGTMGAGFIIDRRGWIATNYHVIAQANDHTTVLTENGHEYEVAGLIAADPHRDIAIIKMATQPFKITVADISYVGEPTRLDSVFAYGHPEGNDFSTSRGVVSRVVDTAHLPEGSKYFLAIEMDAPVDHIWIQHDAGLAPGNSGGPLIDEDFNIIGINTWVDRAADMGFASHISYVRDMAENARDEAEPFPPLRTSGHNQRGKATAPWKEAPWVEPVLPGGMPATHD